MPALEIHSEWAKTLAEQLVASGDAPPAGLSDAERLALAWALKDLAIAAWSTEPVNVLKTVEPLLALSEGDIATSNLSTIEIEAIKEWVAGIANITRGRMTDAIMRLDAGSSLFRKIDQGRHAAHAQIPKIIAHSVLGQHSEAATCGELILHELTDFGELQAAGKVSLNLGNLQYQLNNFHKALHHYKVAAELFGPTEHSQWFVMSQIGIADTLAALGNFDESLRIYTILEQDTEHHNFAVLNAMVRESRSLVHLARGQYSEALTGLESARQRYETLDMPQHLATSEKQFADAYLALRLLPEALALFDKASARFENLEMPVELAWTLVQRARTLSALGRCGDEIADALQRAARLFSLQEITAGSASVLLARAEIALASDETTVAATLACEAEAAFTLAKMDGHSLQSLLVHAHAILRKGGSVAAGRLFAVVLDRAQALQLLSIQVRSLVGLGQAALRQGQGRAAEAHFASAIEYFEHQRSTLPSDDLRNAFLIDHLRPYEELLRIDLAASENEPTTERASCVLLRLERFRARAMGERLGDSHNAGLDVRSRHADAELRARLNWLSHRSQKLQDEGENIDLLVVESHRIELELLENARRHRLKLATHGRIVESADIDTVTLRESLASGEVLVEFGVLDNELFACLVTRTDISLHRKMAQWSEVTQGIGAARFHIETLRQGASVLDRHLLLLVKRSKAALRRLHELIWVPICSAVAGYTRVLVIPHELLGTVPFAALHDGECYLSQRHEMVVAPSARVALHGLGRIAVRPRHAVVLGESSHLIHAAEEAQFVASLFDEATVLTGRDANGDALRAASTQADVLHLACHGQFRSDNPMFSALHLVDGPFTVQDVEALRLPQGIVVLSACESGVATASKGDEVIGLVRAFLIAGAARVVASLWPVDDKVTSEFMAVFYSSLRSGAAPAAALRSAQLEVMKTHPHPFHWAAFTVYGGW